MKNIYIHIYTLLLQILFNKLIREDELIRHSIVNFLVIIISFFINVLF